jgi:CIC family chloride channel protein
MKLVPPTRSEPGHDTTRQPGRLLSPRLGGFRLGWREDIRLTVLAVIVGTASGLAAVGFRALILVIQNGVYLHHWGVREGVLSAGPLPWWTILVPAAGGAIAGLLTTYVASEARGHGVPVVMESVALHGGFLRGRLVAVQALASGVTIGTGGSAGREGPIVQIGAAAGSALARALSLPGYMVKILLACGSAAGIAATFNTPIAGVLFAIEIVLLELKTRSFIPLVVASVFGTVVSRIFLGRHPAFAVPPYDFVRPAELLLYLLLGVAAGLVAVAFINVLSRVEHAYERLPVPDWAKPATGGLLVGAIGLMMPEVLGVGYGTVGGVLAGGGAAAYLLLLAGMKIAAVSLTLGSGGSGGVFAPSLFIGAMLGGAFGGLVHAIAPGFAAAPGAYALVGMAAVFAGSSRATLTAIIILFELTQDYHIILPLMFACVVSNLVAWVIEPDSIYTRRLRERGVHVVQDLEPDVLARTRVRDVMTRQPETVHEDDSVRQAYDLILSTGRDALPVLDTHGGLEGIVTHLALSRAFSRGEQDRPVGEVAERDTGRVHPDRLLFQVVGDVERFGHLVVVDPADPRRLVGVLSGPDLLKARRPETLWAPGRRTAKSA